MAPQATEKKSGEETRRSLIEATQEILASDGFKGVTTRSVAERADVALSLVHHHFGGKRGLLMAAMGDDLARVGRYRELMDEADSLTAAWDILIREFRADLKAGVIRAEWETYVVGLGDVEFIEQWRGITEEWRKLYERTLDRLLPKLDFEPALPSSVLASMLVDFFLGTEAELLAAAAVGEKGSLQVLDEVGQKIRELETG